MTLNNTIVAGNGVDIYTVGDLHSGLLFLVPSGNGSEEQSSDIWFSGSNNLIGKVSGDLGLVDGVNGNQVGTADAPIDPMLSDLVQFENGLWGYYLLADSPAINAGNNSLARGPNGAPLSHDSCGNFRILGGTVDIGACEFGPDMVGKEKDVRLEEEVLPARVVQFTPPANFSPGVATVPRRSELPVRRFIRPTAELTDAVLSTSSWNAGELAAVAKELQRATVKKSTAASDALFALDLELYAELD